MENITARISLENLTACKGQFTSVSFKSEKKPAAKHKGTKLEKIVSGVFRAGIDYANLASVKDAVASGERGPVQDLPWGEWELFPYVISHKETRYVRLYPTKNCKLTTEYRVNGAVVTGDEFRSYLTPSEAKKSDSKPDCMTIKLDNIVSIG